MSDMGSMKDFITVKEMAEKLGLQTNTVKHRLYLRGIKPICKDAIYELSALDQISDFQPKGFQPNNTLAKKKVAKKAVPTKTAKKPAAKKGKNK